MPYRSEAVEKYLADASAGRPTPGGGSASAMAGAVGAAMACMAANFTVGKKKFKDVWPQVGELLAKCSEARDKLLQFADDDVAAYAHVARAYGMPKESPEEKSARAAAIQGALKVAMATPLKTFQTCAGALLVFEELADLANPNLISDVGVAAALVLGALEGAQLNVEINLGFIKDEDLVAATRAQLEQAGPSAREAARKTLDKVYERITQ
ncbi:MAG: cyclodeaminase/cyclohydrolase family protein [Planctomycetota bacterium]